MPQQTNLNVSPYFDDFDANNDYYKVLFKPGYPVQARELTTLQSILQNQIEKFGQHFFKEGAKVIPGNTAYNALYYAVQLNNTFSGVPVEAYLDQLVGTKIIGETSGITAVIEKVLSSADSIRGTVTLYVNYLGSSTQNNQSQQFFDGENLLCSTSISSGLLGNSIIVAGQAFASTISNNATSIASAFSIQDGVYFIRGQFLNVAKEILILDQYGNKPNYRIGLYINEEVVNSDMDESLNDNSQGFNNYAAPGADRLKISVSLFKKSLTDFNDGSFIELGTVVNGVLRSQTIINYGQGGYSDKDWTDILARRTYAESGDYYVSPFDLSIKESLNDNLGNRGVYEVGQFTSTGSTPNDDLALYQISPGKAFIRGYEIETLNSSFIDAPKTRTTETSTDQSLIYNTGPTLKLNRVYGAPQIGIGNTYYVSLRDSRIGSSSTTAYGREIGVARVYDFKLEAGSYNTSNSNINEWHLSLYDIQTVTEIELNEPVELSVPTRIVGNSSGASGFLKESVVNSKYLLVYDKSGDFIKNESFSFDGLANGRVATAITSYSISDIQSVYGTVGSASTFNADVIQSPKSFVGLATIGAYRYLQNENFLVTSISSVVGGGSTVIYVNNTNGVSIGSSIYVFSRIGTSTPGVAATVLGIGASFVNIALSDSSPYVTSNTQLTSTVGFGSTTIYVNADPNILAGIHTATRISVGTALTSVPIVSVGNTFLTIGIGSTSSSRLSTTISSPVAAGSTQFFVGILTSVDTSTKFTIALPSVTTTTSAIVAVGSTQIFVSAASSISIGNTVNVGTALTNVTVTGVGSTSFFIGIANTAPVSIPASQAVTIFPSLVNVSVTSVGSSSFFIGAGNTTAVQINAGTAVTYNNISSMITGTGVTFTNLAPYVPGDVVNFSTPIFSSKIISTNLLFPGNYVKVGNLVSYFDSRLTDPVFAKTYQIGTNYIEVVGVTTVTNICEGKLPSTTLSVPDLNIISTQLETSTDNTLYTRLPKNNISSVDLTDSYLIIRKTFNVNISNNQLSTALDAGTNEAFLPFDEERYALIRSNGNVEILTSDKFSFTNGSSTLQIYNLGSNDTGATLIATLRKNKPKAKVKRKNKVNSIVIDKSKYDGSGTGGQTFDDGLVFGNYPYGTRVQDEVLSLNTSDIIEVHGIFESLDSSTEPSAPTMDIGSITGPITQTYDLIVGEKIVGQSSKASAIVAEKLGNAKISFLYKNNNTFKEGETILFEESGATSQITALDLPSKEISPNYTFTTGQGQTFYNYGTLKRKSESQEPYYKVKVYFANAYYDLTDDGDITTVNSYSNFSYGKDILSTNGIRNSDIIDIRPKVSNYQVLENSRSPLEFFGRVFNNSGNSSSNILASDESINISFSYYLGRIDRLFLTKDGKFQVIYGNPSEKLQKPGNIDDSLEIATITLPPYLYNVSDAKVEFLSHKRYRMVDIKKLEDRIKNLEYYTALTLLESNTSNLFIPDNDGLNRFKSGFFVDNFTSLLAQEDSITGDRNKNSVDLAFKELRPSHYTTSVDLVSGPATGISPGADLSFTDIEGINVRKTGDVLTLDYSEVEWLKQTFATRSESVTPFLISFWQGTLELTPASDTWVDTTRLEAKVIQTQGNYAETLANAVRNQGVDPQTGFAPVIWNAWVTNWTGTETVRGSQTRTVVSGGGWQGGGGAAAIVDTQTTTVFQDQLLEVRDTGVTSRTGTRTVISEQFDLTSVGDRVVDRSIVPFMRSRNIQFVAKRIKPLTRIYAFFDGVNVTKYCVPKLLEISMTSGVFQVGETVSGTTIGTGVGSNGNLGSDSPKITFRVAASNHREGPYDAPTISFPQNPYTSQILQNTYSSTSNILNVDTFSLANQPQGTFSGWVESGMTLVGETSGAQATITNVRLVSDIAANLHGSFFVPNPNNNIHPKFETGTKTLTFVNNDANDQNAATTVAEEAFISSGTLETVQENIISVRNARIENKQEFEERAASRTTGTQIVNSTVVSQSSRQVVVGWYDPLAQSFLVDNSTGVFLTRCDVYFRTKDDMNIPVVFQLRTMANGYPTQKVLPFSEIVLDPEQINTSADGSIATTFTFKAPIYLEGEKEYAICLASNSTKYSVYISRIGENDLLTQTYISNQPYLGSLFKSQNASTWEASQWEDLKFNLYRADFLESGTVEFYNPELTKGNKQIANLLPDPLKFNSRKIRVSISSTLTDAGIRVGNTISQLQSGGTANLVGTAGSATGTLNIINAGIGYTPSSGGLTFNNISLESITGSGKNATANITINNGVSIAATIVNGGSGYKSGDVLGITSIGAFNTGTNARFSLVSIAATNQLILDNIQGDFLTGVGNTLQYTNSVGVSTDINGTGSNLLANSIDIENDGLHIKVNHKNHGMYSGQDLVVLSGIEPDTKATKLSIPVAFDSNSTIYVEDSTEFGTFENVVVSAQNPGYLIIGTEVISYTNVSSGAIQGSIVRSISGTASNYPAGTPVYKYELNGISLRRINTTHDTQDVTVTDPFNFNYYNVKIDTSTNGVNRSNSLTYPTLYIKQTKSSGGTNVFSTQNIPFEVITPIVQNVTVQGTSISAEMRSVSASSISGNELPFTDQGYEIISINKPNYVSSPRLISSRVNEVDNLNDYPGNKSFNMRMLLSTTDTYLSPIIDTQRISAIFTSNRVNQVITDYVNDGRVNTIAEDPTAFQYLSKEISLENSATSLKILVSSHINNYCDIRAFYAISETSNFTPIYTPFPGWENLDTRGRVIDISKNTGSSDMFISKTQSLGFESENIEFKEYNFTADNLPSFRSYRIKLILTSTSQVYVPRMRDLRVIALA